MNNDTTTTAMKQGPKQQDVPLTTTPTLKEGRTTRVLQRKKQHPNQNQNDVQHYLHVA